MAAGSHGCRPNCADLPVAAMMKPISGMVKSCPSAAAKICWSSHELSLSPTHTIPRIRPTSPTRL